MKTAIVTGASKGVGYATVKLLSENGYKVIAVSRDLSKVSGLVGENVEVYQMDITNANEIKKLFKSAYTNIDSLANATRKLANELFGSFGLVILDADNSELKKQFIPYIKEELLQNTSYKTVSKTVEKLKKYPTQVNPREINIFYIEDNLRERIVFKNNIYKVNHTEIQFTESEISKLIDRLEEDEDVNKVFHNMG